VATIKVSEGVYQVGGPELTSPEDCCVYLIDLGRPILIDTGSGTDVQRLVRNIESLGYSPSQLSLIVLTHCHIDHVGGLPYFEKRFKIPAAIHELDAAAVEEGDTRLTAANWYGTRFPPTAVKMHLKGDEGSFQEGPATLRWLHTPGHTPGSISLILDNGLFRILFGQDIHGPFYASFGSDLDQWASSMHRLIDEEPDILCEGHFGIIRPASEVRNYIEDYLRDYGK
jgi:glyoxylase-like metal-dependent hydrolase (beta-lactamase superfamily II)